MSTFARKPLSAAVKAATVAGSLSLVAAPAQAGFDEVTSGNPFDAITSGTSHVSLVLQDYDGDGDLEAVVFHADDSPAPGFDRGDISFYENTGSASSAAFTHVQDASGYGGEGTNFSENPFASAWYAYGYGHPVSAGDLDGDDVADFVGGTDGSTGVVPSTGFVETDGYGLATDLINVYFGDYSTSSPFYGSGIMSNADSYGYASGLLLDIDNDSDMDVITTDFNQIRVFQNNGTDGYGVLQLNELTGANNPFYAGDAGNLTLAPSYYGAPMGVGDVDNDGDLDVVMGVRFGPADMRLFRNTGSASMAQFEEVTDDDLDVTAQIFAAPVMADIDDDGDDDLVVVDEQSSGPADFRLFRNDGEGAPFVLPSDGDSDDDGLFGGIGFGSLIMAGLALLFRRRR